MGTISLIYLYSHFSFIYFELKNYIQLKKCIYLSSVVVWYSFK